MSERAITDPSQHGWVEVDGKWMWDASGGSIQDGDTEGQITTWDGTEWAPEGAVVVDGGNVGIGTDSPASVVTSASNSLVVANSTGGSASASFQTENAQWEIGSWENSGGIFGVFNNATASFPLTIDADGFTTMTNGAKIQNQYLFMDNGGVDFRIGYDGSGGSMLTNVSNHYMRFATNDTERLRIDADGNVHITGKLFINGEEVGAGGSSYTAGNGITIDGEEIKMSGSYSGTFTANNVMGTG